jgi:hypothetical protein
MIKRAYLGIALSTLSLGLLALPARSQCNTFRFSPPASTTPQRGQYTVRWSDDAEIYEGLSSITWYYASRADLSDKRRMTIRYSDDFSRFRRFWRCEGPSASLWKVRQDRYDRFQFLSGPKEAAPVISQMATDRDVVVSMLVRPQGTRNEFALGLRVQDDGQSYEIRNDEESIHVVRGGKPLRTQRLNAVKPGNWYWYEVGVRSLQTKAGQTKAVEVRVRIFDETRRRLLVHLSTADRPDAEALLTTGRVALWGPADFAEVYVDPWAARWEDDSRNEFQWDTTGVQEGDYYLVAELADGKSEPRYVVSSFRVEVRGQQRAEAQ